MDAGPRKVLCKLILNIRHLLEGYYDDRGVLHTGDLEQRLNQLGVWKDRPAKTLEELPQLSEVDSIARRTVDAYVKYREETGVSRVEAVTEFIRESAYTWFNRIFSLRCMESRGIIDPIILQKDSYGGLSLQHNRLVKQHPELCIGEDEGLYTVLFQEFNRRAYELPMLFNPESPALTLRPSVSAIKKLVSILSGREPINNDLASDEMFIAPDAFGWAYQCWNIEEKDRVFERVGTDKAKIEGKDIIPATCIYTEPYMVKFLVQNSLGTQWSCMHPESRLNESWEYYIKDADRSPIEKKPVREITFLDPACGSGHFLLEAFNLFYQMYSDEGEITKPEEVCYSILENNLFGIDIDERAVQISVVVLWMKAKEKAPELDTSGLYGFQNHLVATNIRLPKERDHLEEFLRKHPEDRPLQSALESIFKALENVDEIGSLLKIDEPLEYAFKRLINDAGIQTTLWSNGFKNIDSWRESVIEQLQEHFNEEAKSSDLSQIFFSKSMNKGLKLLNLISNQYNVIATNPPYMGSKNMGSNLKNYVIKNYEVAKRDLYSSFILRSFLLAKNSGCIGLVTPHSWLYLTSYAEFRSNSSMKFQGMLKETIFDTIAHLGPNSFNEGPKGFDFGIVMFIALKKRPSDHNIITVLRLIGYKTPEEKASKIINPEKENLFKISQNKFLKIDESPLCYWIKDAFINLFDYKRVSDYADVVQGLTTANDKRFVRYNWEICNIPNNKRWILFQKGGGYKKWYGSNYWYVDWEYDGIRIKLFDKSYVRNEKYYFKKGYTYSATSGGSIGVRLRTGFDIFSHKGSSIVSKNEIGGLGAILNSPISTYLIRLINPTVDFTENYLARIPIKSDLSKYTNVEKECIKIKKEIMSYDISENSVDPSKILFYNKIDYYRLFAILNTLEGFINYSINNECGFSDVDLKNIYKETGIHVGEYKLILKYSKFNNIFHDYKILGLFEYLQSNTIDLDDKYINKIKYEISKLFMENMKIDKVENIIKDKFDTISITNPIPLENIIEEISHIVKIHPLSVYLLLKEGIEQEGWRCLPEEKRTLEDRLTVLIIKLLGHRWPQQIEMCEPIPDWADPDGIIPLTKGTNETILLDRIRQRIKETFEDEILIIEREFEDLMDKSLEEWLLYDFFRLHIIRFKKRPIAWQIQSTPPSRSGRGSKRRIKPAFSCLAYCQRVDGDTFHKIRSQYVGPLKNGYEAELRTLETIGLLNTEQIVRQTKLEILIKELEEFDTKLQGVINEGFDSTELKKLIGDEPLDRWCSIDGEAPPPVGCEGLYMQERAYVPDVNDGVRVNIAPLQREGLLASDVLVKKDVDRAITDRAVWRAYERRWCREGKLPQPGWWEKRKLNDKPR